MFPGSALGHLNAKAMPANCYSTYLLQISFIALLFIIRQWQGTSSLTHTSPYFSINKINLAAGDSTVLFYRSIHSPSVPPSLHQAKPFGGVCESKACSLITLSLLRHHKAPGNEPVTRRFACLSAPQFAGKLKKKKKRWKSDSICVLLKPQAS